MTTESTALVAPTDNEIEQIRRRGAKAVAHRNEIAKLEKQIAGLTWGAGTSMMVQGSSLSPMTRAVMAEFCALVRANPMYHVDILGGKPYLNAVYWSDLINSRPDFHHYEQRDLSPSVEKALRDRAARHREVAAELMGDEAAQRRSRALDLEDEADDIALARAQWSAPAWAHVVIQTTIHKFIDAAPIEAIRRGEVADIDRYIVPVHECNWAGGRPKARKRDGGEYEADPIGNSEPAKSARTRSLRRAAVKSFSAWMQAYEQQIAKAEEAIEAEYEIIRSERYVERAQLPAPNGPQAVRIGSGEPSASAPHGAQPLPVEVDTTPTPAPQPPTEERVHGTSAPAQQSASEVFDFNDVRRRYFANLTDAAIGHDAARKAWQAENGLPASTGTWTPEQWRLALELLVGPARAKFEEVCMFLGNDPEQTQQLVLGRPAYRRADYEACLSWLHAEADAEDADGQQELIQ